MDYDELMGYAVKIMMPSLFGSYFFNEFPEEERKIPLKDAKILLSITKD